MKNKKEKNALENASKKVKDFAKDTKDKASKAVEKASDKVKETLSSKEDSSSKKSEKKSSKKESKKSEEFIIYQRVKVSGGNHVEDPMFKDRVGTVNERTPDGSYVVQFADDFGGIVIRTFTGEELSKA